MDVPAKPDPAPGLRLAWLERVGVALLLLAAFVPRVRDLTAPLDREFEGFQGAAFLAFAVNYERVGFARDGGYPLMGIELSQDPGNPGYLYANHPPLFPILIWASLKTLGPKGWNTNWEAGEPPDGAEAAARLPMLALHMLGLFGMWWALRQATGATEAMVGLAILAMLPISAIYAKLINYETAVWGILPFTLGFHARWLKTGSRAALIGVGVTFLVACSVTFAPLFFAPALVLQTLWRRGWRAAIQQGALLGAAALVPMAAHGIWVRVALPESTSDGVLVRAERLLLPLFDGSAPLTEWLRRQLVRLNHFLTTPVLLAAIAGLAVELARAWRARPFRNGHGTGGDVPQAARVSLALPLFAGGALSLGFFYRHTFDGAGIYDGQTTFLIHLAPAAAAATAALLLTLAPALFRLRAGIAPLVVAVSLIGLPGIARTNELRQRWRAPGPRDDATLTTGPATPLPITSGRQIAAILPAGSIGLYPRCMGFTLAHDFYSWRMLVPFHDEASWGRAMALLQHSGLTTTSRYVLLPVSPPPGCIALVEQMRARLVAEGFERIDASEHWERWPAFQ